MLTIVRVEPEVNHRPVPSPLRLFALAVSALLLGGADSPRDLTTIKDARSTAAEWAAVNRLAAAGRLSGTYVGAMRSEARRQLESARKTLSDPNGPAARELGALTRLPDDADPALLDLHARRLLAIEDGLESPRP
jgi:hypothetical protein